MKKIIFLLLGFIYIGALSAQERYFDERYVYTQNHLYPVLINPGAAGFNDDHEVLFNYNNRWSSFEGSPKTFTFSYNGLVADKLGLGAIIMKDSYGPLEMTKGQLSLSYGIKTAKNNIRVGMSGEYISHKLSSGALENLAPDDFKIFERLDGSQFFDVTFGLMGEFEDKLSYGIVFPSIVNSRIDDDITSTFKREFSYIINVGYKLEVPTYDFKVFPSIFVKKLNGVPGHIDLNLLFRFLDDKLAGGITYSVGGENRIGFLVGTSVNKIDFNYTYNVSNNNFQHYNNGSHEISVGLRLSRSKEKVKNDL